MRKPCKNMRIKEAIEICEGNPREDTFDYYYEDVRQQVKTCLEKLSEICGYNNEKIEYEIVDADLTQKQPDKDGECFFIQFTKDGYVVVVGAGYDYGISKNDNYLNVKIINILDKEWSNKAILVFVKGIKPVKGHCGAGHETCEHLLQCRNGVEMYLGESILEGNIPILNHYSHINYIQYLSEKRPSEKWKEEVERICKEYRCEK